MTEKETKTKNEQDTTVTENGVAPDQAAAPDLTISDLKALRSIIDVASQRGTFKPTEMVTVGQTYEKLDRFLKAVESSQDSNTSTPES